MIHEFHFTIEAALPKPGYVVRLQVNGDKNAIGVFAFQEDGEAIAGDLDDIAYGNPSRDAIKNVGDVLWVGLTETPLVLDAFQKTFHDLGKDSTAVVRLSTPPELARLPWEALWYRAKGFLCSEQGSTVVHAPRSPEWIAHPTGPRRDPLRMLVIIPERSGLRVGLERDFVLGAFSKLGMGSPKVLDGRVTAELLHQTLKDHWDIIHFTGHSRLNVDKRIEIDLNRTDGEIQPYDGEDFAADVAASGACLVTMNSCSGNAGHEEDELAGFGPLLMRSGVPAVVAMRYAIGDNMASLFARHLYEQLFGGYLPGRVDRAVEEARAALRRSAGPDEQRAFITPVLHLAPGYEQLLALTSVTKKEAHRKKKPEFGSAQLPESLKAALQRGSCIPVIGPGVLRATAQRDRPAPAGPLELAHNFASSPRPKYPRHDDFALCERAGEWMNAQLLQWVSQYYERQNRGRGDLITEIQGHYPPPPPSLIRDVAQWRVPLLFYTHFDGYLEACVLSGDSWLSNVVYEFDKALPTIEARANGPRSLVLLRGSHLKSDVPLVLTEDDHDELLSRIARLHPTLRDAPRRPAHSVLFLGVSPRDPIIRHLSQQILESGARRSQGPTFFEWPNPDDVDRAYWEKFNVNWLQFGTAALVRLVSEVSG